MSILVVRHGLSEANNRNNLGTLAFANKSAPLMEQGRQQAQMLGEELAMHFGVVAADSVVATSELERTRETAKEAGFKKLASYALLDEVEHGMELPELQAALKSHHLPKPALEKATAILDNPPLESIWITHGLVIAGLCHFLGAYQDARFIPRFCEIRRLPIEIT